MLLRCLPETSLCAAMISYMKALNHCFFPLVLKIHFNLYFCVVWSYVRHSRPVSLMTLYFMFIHRPNVCVQCKRVTLKYIYIWTKICNIRCTVLIFEHINYFPQLPVYKL